MQLLRLEIEDLPGISPGFTLGPLEPGLTVIHGPNGSGKSSIVRAIRALLYPDPNRDRAVRLRATFSLGGRQLQVENLHGTSSWREHGNPVDAPALPPKEHLACYCPALDTLLFPGASEDAFAALINRELAGGYDLQAAGEAAKFRVGAQFGRPEAAALADASRTLRQRMADYEGLTRESERLDELRTALELARRACVDLRAVRAGEAWLEQRRVLRILEQRLTTFPQAVERLTGEEEDRLARLGQTLHAKEQERSEVAARRRQAEATLAATGLGPASAELAHEPHLLDEQSDKLASLERLDNRLEEAAAARQQLRAELAVSAEAMTAVDYDPPPPVSPILLSTLEGALTRRRAQNERLVSTLAQLQALPESDSEATDGSAGLAEARAALLAWLRAPTPRRLSAWPLAVLAMSLLAGIAGIAVSLTVHAAFAWLFLFYLALLWPLRLLWPAAAPVSSRATAVSRYTQTGLSPPAQWDEASVEARLRDLETQLRAADELSLRSRQRESLQTQSDAAREQLELLDAELTALAAANGLAELAPDAGTERWLRAAERRDRQLAALRQLDAETSNLTIERETLKEALQAFLAQHGLAPEPAAPMASTRSRFNTLRRRLDTYRDAERDVAEADRALERIDIDTARIRAAVDEIYHTAGLAPGQLFELNSRLALVADYRQVTAEIAKTQGHVAEAERVFRATGTTSAEINAAAEAGDTQRLSDLADECEQLAPREQELFETITRIETQIERARGERLLESARAARDEALVALKERLDEHLLASAGQFLMADVEAEHRSRNEPALMRKADRWLGLFTHHKYELRFDLPGDVAAGSPRPSSRPVPSFRAFDTSNARACDLTVLSTGTRAQLLLALRLAFIEHIEAGREPLPLLLDEALGTSDPARYRAVAAAVHEASTAGQRQSLYLTAQPQEIAYWAEAGATAVVDLSECRKLSAGYSLAGLPTPAPRSTIPEIDGRSAQAYARALGVAPLDPFSPDTAHLFHLLCDDLPLLHRLLTLELETAGQLRSFLNGPAAREIFQDVEYDGLADRLAVFRAWCTAWQRGRGRPLGPADLMGEDSPLSRIFAERFAALLPELGGNARALLDAIDGKHEAAKGLRSKTRQELEEWLRDNAYLDPGPALDQTERFHHSLDDVAGRLAGGRLSPNRVNDLIRALEAGVAAASAVEPAKAPGS